jgi:hypothetical protein
MRYLLLALLLAGCAPVGQDLNACTPEQREQAVNYILECEEQFHYCKLQAIELYCPETEEGFR